MDTAPSPIIITLCGSGEADSLPAAGVVKTSKHNTSGAPFLPEDRDRPSWTSEKSSHEIWKNYHKRDLPPPLTKTVSFQIIISLELPAAVFTPQMR